MRVIEIYEKETGNKEPSNQIFYHEWYTEYVNWLEQQVVKNHSMPNVVKSLPTASDIEIAVKDYADEKICKGDSSARWYDIQYNFRAGIEWVMKRLT